MTATIPNWKALVLAAGFGTRLLPYTRHMPKPLFSIDNQPLIDIIIRQLTRAGCTGVIVNTHHLHQKIEAHVGGQAYDIPVRLSYEPKILGTGGAIKNNAPFLGKAPFMVINSDLYTTIDLNKSYGFHINHSCPVTLVMHDHSRFNTVLVGAGNEVVGIRCAQSADHSSKRLMAFTGIHIIDPQVLEMLPPTGTYCDVIDFYQKMIDDGRRIKARIATGHEWEDVGAIETYRSTAFKAMAEKAWHRALGTTVDYHVIPVASDGSDTAWMRLESDSGRLIACDRGLRESKKTNEAEAFVHINRHLSKKGIAVPALYAADCFAGIFFMEDLGDTHLQALVTAGNRKNTEIIDQYQPVIDQLVKLAVEGAKGFDTAWTCQTRCYDKQLIIEKECRYFTGAFLSGYLGLEVDESALKEEYALLAELTLESAVDGLIHRDMQSRNIMVYKKRPYFIDVQGARLGPIQYDLASLLIDPYANLPLPVRDKLQNYYLSVLRRYRQFSEERFGRGLACCRATRNLQILGAFGYLVGEKKKAHFRPYIPPAVVALKEHIRKAESATGGRFPGLIELSRMARAKIE